MSFDILPTNSNEVIQIINNLKIDKAVGPNSIPTKILKLIKHDISPILAELCNLSFSTGIFPEVLKIAKVIPIYKKKSKLKCENYRPISLLSNIDKILEKIMYKRLYEYFGSNDLIFLLQFCFRQNHSTSYALLNMTEEIKKQIDRGNIGCGVFIDFQKAFDTVDHNILIEKLNHYGVRDLQNEWFKSYLINRKQYVTVNNESSDLENIKWGYLKAQYWGLFYS